MRLKYPAEAFALGIILFSAGMKEAFAAGILVIFTAVFAEFLKNLLEPLVPRWSLEFSVFIGSAAVAESVFCSGFAVLGMPLGDYWTELMVVILGAMCAKFALYNSPEADYGELFWESGILWGFWILFGIAREFFATGSIFGNVLVEQASFFSKSLLGTAFGFLAAGMALAFTNGILKKRSGDTQCWFVAVPMVIFSRPFEMVSFGGIIGFLWTVGVSLALFFSVKKVLKFSRTGAAYRGLPVEMLSMGFIYMILSIY